MDIRHRPGDLLTIGTPTRASAKRTIRQETPGSAFKLVRTRPWQPDNNRPLDQPGRQQRVSKYPLN